ncbi:MAG: GC-type dockerin domain-anchored protein [Planctomycetota bacterium]
MRTTAILASCLLASHASAQAFHEGDIAVGIPDGDHLPLGIYNPNSPSMVDEFQLFNAVFNSAGLTNDPGFDSPSGIFPAGVFAGLDVLSAVRLFDSGNFDTIAPVPIGISFGPFLENVSPDTDVLTPGNYVAGTSSNGEFHNHFIFTLDPFDTGAIVDGIYALHLRMVFPSPINASSNEFWMLFSMNATQTEIDEAFAAAEADFLPQPLFSDWTTTGATLPGQPGYRTPDGIVDLDDLGVYLVLWLEGNTDADITTAGATLEGQPGFRTPDGIIDLDDLGTLLGAWLVGE